MSNDQRSRFLLPLKAACSACRYFFLVVFCITFFLQQSLGLCIGLLNPNDLQKHDLFQPELREIKFAAGNSSSSRSEAIVLQIEVAEDDDLPEEHTCSIAYPFSGNQAMAHLFEKRVTIGLLRQSSVVQNIKPSPLFLLHHSWKGFLIWPVSYFVRVNAFFPCSRMPAFIACG